MALPTPVKTWQFSRGRIACTGSSTVIDHKQLVLAIKNSLIGFASNPWQVAGSSDGSTYAMDSVDRWATTTNMQYGLYNSSNLSWIVLKQPQMNAGNAGGLQLLLDCGVGTPSFNERGLNTKISMVTGFSNSVNTLNPATAADNQTLLVNDSTAVSGGQPVFHGNTSSIGTYMNYVVMQSTDGLCTRVFANLINTVANPPLRGSDRTCLFWQLETLTDLEVGTTLPYMALMASGYSSDTYYRVTIPYDNISVHNLSGATAKNGTTNVGRARPVGTATTCRWSVLSSGGANTGSGAVPANVGSNINIYDGNLDFTPIDIVANNGYIGRLVDMYLVPEHAGVVMPASGSPVWDNILPGVVVPCGGIPFKRQ